MKLLSQLDIYRNEFDASIQLLQGDLTAIPPDHATDILVISAYPGSYEPYKTTLMAALYDKGIFVGEMAKDKEVDLISQVGCWLSKPLKEEQQKQFNFKRILCFEPGRSAFNDSSVVGNIFRCINTFAFESQHNVIAMPVVASGNQKMPLAQMVPSILENAIFWLENGLPLRTIKLVLYSDDQVEEALPIFSRIKQDYESVSLKDGYGSQEDSFTRSTKNIEAETLSAKRSDVLNRKFGAPSIKKNGKKSAPSPAPAADPGIEKSTTDSGIEKSAADPGIEKSATGSGIEKSTADPGIEKSATDSGIEKSAAPTSEQADKYDYFISYAHTHSDLIHSFVENMKLKNSQLRIFYDKDSIPPGGLWIKQISEAIQKAGKVLVFLSPDYDNSPVCWDEFQCAKLMEYNRRTSVIQTIYLYKYNGEMPPIMGIYSYIDCREGDMDKLLASIPKLVG